MKRVIAILALVAATNAGGQLLAAPGQRSSDNGIWRRTGGRILETAGEVTQSTPPAAPPALLADATAVGRRFE